MIRTEPLLAAVAAGLVTVGSAVPVAAGTVCVGVSVPVDSGVRVGNAVEVGKVGIVNGVNVTGPKLNKGVGVATIPALGKIFGLGTAVGELRDANGNKLIRIEQRKQNTSRNKPGRRIFPI